MLERIDTFEVYSARSCKLLGQYRELSALESLFTAGRIKGSHRAQVTIVPQVIQAIKNPVKGNTIAANIEVTIGSCRPALPTDRLLKKKNIKSPASITGNIIARVHAMLNGKIKKNKLNI